jgi:hypothetical protein
MRTQLKTDALNAAHFFGSLLTLPYNNTRLNPNIQWVDGVKVVTWYGCMNQTNSTPGIEIRVKYTGDRSNLKPYSKYENPVVASVQMLVYKGKYCLYTEFLDLKIYKLFITLLFLADNLTAPKNIDYIENLSFNVVELENTKPELKRHMIKVTF